MIYYILAFIFLLLFIVLFCMCKISTANERSTDDKMQELFLRNHNK